MSEYIKMMFIYFLDIPSAPKLHIGLPVVHHGLHVMREGPPVARRILSRVLVCL